MKAMICDAYGDAGVLRMEDVPEPSPAENELKVRIHATSINSWDWELLRGKPWIVRLEGVRKPRYRVLGADVAGVVEAVGRGVSRFKPGDAVFGDLSGAGWGGFAEVVCAHQDAFSIKPSGLTFEEAAALPQAAVMALQGLRQYGDVQRGQRVLVNGAGGGVGTFAVQMAVHFGAEVTGVDTASKLDTIRALGAVQAIDYQREDFTQSGVLYDLILDVAVHRGMRACRRAMNRGGRYVMVGGSLTRIFWAALWNRWSTWTHKKSFRILAHKANQDMAFIAELAEHGRIRSVIDKRYRLKDVPDAIRYIADGRVCGKLIISIAS